MVSRLESVSRPLLGLALLIRPARRAAPRRSSSCSRARAARPARRRTPFWPSWRASPTSSRCPSRSTTGTISAGRTRSPIRPSRPGSGPMPIARRPAGLHAADDRQRHEAVRRLRPGADRALDQRPARRPDRLPVDVEPSERDGVVTVDGADEAGRPHASPRSGSCRSLRTQTVPIGRGENRRPHHHLRQCGARHEPDRRMARRRGPLRVPLRAPGATATAMWCCCRPSRAPSPGAILGAAKSPGL